MGLAREHSGKPCRVPRTKRSSRASARSQLETDVNNFRRGAKNCTDGRCRENFATRHDQREPKNDRELPSTRIVKRLTRRSFVRGA